MKFTFTGKEVAQILVDYVTSRHFPGSDGIPAQVTFRGGTGGEALGSVLDSADVVVAEGEPAVMTGDAARAMVQAEIDECNKLGLENPDYRNEHFSRADDFSDLLGKMEALKPQGPASKYRKVCGDVLTDPKGDRLCVREPGHDDGLHRDDAGMWSTARQVPEPEPECAHLNCHEPIGRGNHCPAHNGAYQDGEGGWIYP